MLKKIQEEANKKLKEEADKREAYEKFKESHNLNYVFKYMIEILT